MRGVLRASWWRTRSREAVAAGWRIRRRGEQRYPVITHLVERMIAVNVFDSATRVAAQVLLTVVPLLFVVASLAPQGLQEQLTSSLRSVFGFTGQSGAQLDELFAGTDEEVQNAVGAVGSVMVLLSATAVSRAVQRLCRRAWGIPRGAARVSVWRWVVWILVWTGLLVVQGPVRDGFGTGLWLGLPLTLLLQTAAWWWTQRLLLGGAVGWLPLLPGALLSAVAVTALSLGARLYMPLALNRVTVEFGGFGSVFVLLSWLIALCVAIAIGLSTGAVLAQEPYLAERLGSPVPDRGSGPPRPA